MKRKHKRICTHFLYTLTEILHDYDNPFPSGAYALKRGIRLILYALSKKIPFLKKYCMDIYRENYRYALTLAKLDSLLRINSRFGIHTHVSETLPDLKYNLAKMHVKIHDHTHVSPVLSAWHPELPYPIAFEQYHFDQKYARGLITIQQSKVAVFHADYPHLFADYIDYLYKVNQNDLLNHNKFQK